MNGSSPTTPSRMATSGRRRVMARDPRFLQGLSPSSARSATLLSLATDHCADPQSPAPVGATRSGPVRVDRAAEGGTAWRGQRGTTETARRRDRAATA